ncbi:carnitine dehydratase [Mangrovactinospora gilvigrisea]|uniref:Carnitine dehydratase n=1 Tax=Mangrovactinospora gilvigrisea TaxID=1428644 RepID=A0A1J7BH24_9ACTN|nr:CaiB/BaiF CoA-transferase family protein [Mangrovactinospora gilvigrisea]OIV37958.1 carnitine dehydratase [Mangrovactinospora gilvigrisea]
MEAPRRGAGNRASDPPAPRVGILAGVKVVEFAGIGPAPFAAGVLAAHGADVLTVHRPGALPSVLEGVLDRGRHPLDLDLKDPAARARALDLLARADVLIDPYRPGSLERLGLGPAEALAANPRLVYARMTGWGQEGPLAGTAGHDITYTAISGALGASARYRERPVPPVNFVGDFGGGGMLLLFGIVCALRDAERGGRGQVVDAAMLDGSALLTTMVHDLRASGSWPGPAGTNLLDTGAPFYDTYRTADGRFVAVGALEPAFYDALLAGLGLAADGLPDRDDPANWPTLRERFTRVFATRTRDDWAARFAGTDACVAPVLDLDEAPVHPHTAARGTFAGDPPRPAPAPRFSRTPGTPPPVRTEADTAELLKRWFDGSG